MAKQCNPCSECGCTPAQQQVGPEGVGIQSITHDAGEMTIVTTNGISFLIPLPQGEEGVGIDNISIVGYTMTITYTDATTQDISIPSYPDYVLPATPINIVDIQTGDSIKEIVDHIINYAEDKTVNKEDLIKGGEHELPFQNYTSTVVTKTNDGGTDVIIPAIAYYIDGHRITVPADTLTLTDDKDNYITVLKADWTYSFVAVALGAAPPASTSVYEVIAKIPVTGGLPGTLTQVIKDAPIGSDQIEDDAITEGKIANNAVTYPKLPMLAEHSIIVGGAGSLAESLNMIIASAGVLDNEYVFHIYEAVNKTTSAKMLGVGDIVNSQHPVISNLFYLYINSKSVRPEFMTIVDSGGNPVEVEKGDILFANEDKDPLTERHTSFQVLRHPGAAGWVLVSKADGTYEWQDLLGS